MKEHAKLPPKKEKAERNENPIILAWANHQNLVLLVTLCLAVVVPSLINTRYFLTLMINCCMYGVLSLSLNVLTGFMGITSLGHAAFFGIGAYTAAIFSTRFNTSFFINFFAAMFVAGLIALLLGLPTLKATGKHLAIITLGFCEIIRIIELNWMSLTMGPLGIHGIHPFSLFGVKLSTPLAKYFISLCMLIFAYYVTSSILHSRVGRAVTAIRDNEIAAQATGIDVFRYKLLIFSISAALAGMAGAFYAHHVGFIDPKAFTLEQSILIVSMLILGGIGSVQGSIVGAILLSVIPELLRGLAEFRFIIYGLVIVVMMVLKPNGLLGGFNFRYIHQKYLFQKKKGEDVK